jgi:hypothetical protein
VTTCDHYPPYVTGDGLAEDDLSRTGVIFVHGIGVRSRGDAFFDWARPIVDVLASLRHEHDEEHPGDAIGSSSVTSASVSDPDQPWLELSIPALGGRLRSRWLLTEAYWAGDVPQLSFLDSIRFLQPRIPGILRGIERGYGARQDRRWQRLRRLLQENQANPDPLVQARVDELRRSFSVRWTVIDRLDAGRTRIALALALIVIAPLRTIPIEAIRRRAVSAIIDSLLIDWLPELPVILRDQAQAAAARTRLLERAAWLKSNGCRDIVLVAHSGGAILSYAALLGTTQSALPISKLITFGQALGIAWRLEAESGDWVPGNPLRGDLREHRPDLIWADVWASDDPAAAGELHEVDGCPLIAVGWLGDRPDDGRIHVQSRPATNLMDIGQDHDAYWSNDEDFVIPLIRHLDDPTGDGSASRFYRNSLDRMVRSERRRRRVLLLLAWRWAAVISAIASLIVAFVGPVDLATTGDTVAAIWARLPGHELISVPIDSIGGIVTILLSAVGLTEVANEISTIGPVLLGAGVPIVAVLLIYQRGVGSWATHDALERLSIRREGFGPPGWPSARSEGILLVGGLLSIVLASAAPPVGVLEAFLIGVALAAALVRVRAP